MEKMTIDRYITERWADQYEYYSKNAAKNKKLFQRLRVVEIIAAALIPFLTGFIDLGGTSLQLIVGTLGVIVTVLSGVVLLGKYQENWVTFRATAEALKAERIMFGTRKGLYSSGDPESTFVERVEAILGDENQQWKGYMMQENVQVQLNGPGQAPPPAG